MNESLALQSGVWTSHGAATIIEAHVQMWELNKIRPTTTWSILPPIIPSSFHPLALSSPFRLSHALKSPFFIHFSQHLHLPANHQARFRPSCMKKGKKGNQRGRVQCEKRAPGHQGDQRPLVATCNKSLEYWFLSCDWWVPARSS